MKADSWNAAAVVGLAHSGLCICTHTLCLAHCRVTDVPRMSACWHDGETTTRRIGACPSVPAWLLPLVAAPRHGRSCTGARTVCIGKVRCLVGVSVVVPWWWCCCCLLVRVRAHVCIILTPASAPLRCNARSPADMRPRWTWPAAASKGRWRNSYLASSLAGI